MHTQTVDTRLSFFPLPHPPRAWVLGYATASSSNEEQTEELLAKTSIEELLAEIEENEEPVPTRKRRLKAKVKGAIRFSVADSDKTALCATIKDRISDLVLIKKIGERRRFWEH